MKIIQYCALIFAVLSLNAIWHFQAFAQTQKTFLYVGNSAGNYISVIDTDTNAVVGQISEYIYAPEKLFVTPDKENAYVISSGTFGRRVAGIDTSNNTVRTPQITGKGNFMVFSTDSQYAFLSQFGGDFVNIIFTSNNEVHYNSWELDNPVSAMSVRPDGDYVYLDNYYNRESEIWAYDMVAGIFTKTPLPVLNTSYSYHRVRDISQSPTKDEMYITSNSWVQNDWCSGCDEYNYGFLNIYDTSSNEIITTIKVERSRFGDIEISSDGQLACIVDFIYNKLYVFDLTTYSYRSIELDGRPQKLIISKDNSVAYLLQHDLDRIDTIDLSTVTLSGTIAVGDGPFDMLILPNKSYLYVTNQLSGTVSVIDTNTYSIIADILVGDQPKPIIAIPPTNTLPMVMAGENLSIAGNEQTITIIEGTASDDDGDNLLYRWVEGDTVLTDWQDVGFNGEAYLLLSDIPWLSVGQHTMTLEVNDGIATVSDDMILTVENSAPNAAATGGGVYEIFTPIILGGEVSDFDGDLLSYYWTDGNTVLQSDNIYSLYGGDPVDLPTLTIDNLPIGTYTFTLSVEDEINDASGISSVNVEIIDTTYPTLSPSPNKTILWPPDHKMENIIVKMNAYDNSGDPVSVFATITSSEPDEGLGDGDTAPDWTEPYYDPALDELRFQLRAERSGSGEGRIYTVDTTVVDSAGNASSTSIKFVVPHNKSKK